MLFVRCKQNQIVTVSSHAKHAVFNSIVNRLLIYYTFGKNRIYKKKIGTYIKNSISKLF